MKKTVKRHRKIGKYTYLGCVMTKNRSPWCFRMCRPDGEGHGLCGRVAPHTLKGRIQLSVINYDRVHKY